ENGYGINLLPLATFANRTYNEDPCSQFVPKINAENCETEAEMVLMTRMHKAITMIQFKLEDQIITRNKDYVMEDRQLLRHVDSDNQTVTVDGVSYLLNDHNFPTLNHDTPWELTEEEQTVIDRLVYTFSHSEKLQKHIRFMYAKGSMYLVYNNNLLFHACVLLNEDGSFKVKKINDKYYSGRSLMDKYDQMAREAYFSVNDECPYKSDFLWFLWCHRDSPLFGKDKMATFERYFIDDKTPHKECYTPFYTKIDEQESIAIAILKEFKVDPEDGHLINGHVPVKAISGESPIRAGGKQLVIDGGFAKAYQKTTGIAGYTLTYNSYGLTLISHDPFESVDKAIQEGVDIKSTQQVIETTIERKRVKDTDIGKTIELQLHDLEMLISAYRRGIIKEKLY
ncbi:MAG: fructose-bisphosphatase class III, partial [Eubacterium sp.]